MAEERVQRKIVAILAADVAGYTRLVHEDEEGTLAAVKSDIAEAFGPSITARNGRIFKTMGDGLLAEFASVVDAIRCAVEVQRAMADRNAARAEDHQIAFRVGINLGDVVAEGEDLHGDGVNIAARLEGLADPGGILISGTVFDHVQKNVDVGYEFLGEREVKNIADPVRVYRVLTGPDRAGQVIGVPRRPTNAWKWPAIAAAIIVFVAVGVLAWWQPWAPDVEPASIEKMAHPLPDKPSIAVLPFDNLSGDKEQEYFADGLTEDIITSLASFPNLFVIARNSTNKFKDKAVDIRDVAHDLGVRYVLEGSVRKAGDTVRITAQLIDALSGNHIWAKSYDRELKDVFALQDEITSEIGSRLVSKVATAEWQRQSRKGTRNPEAYDLFLRGWNAAVEFNPRSVARAIRLFEQAIEKDPEFARAYAYLGFMRLQNTLFGWAKGPKNTFEYAMELAQKAVALDPQDSVTYRLLAYHYQYQRQFDLAIDAAERAIALSPSNPEPIMTLAAILAVAGRGEDAVKPAETAMRLNPHGPWYLSLYTGYAYYMARRFDEAAAAFERARRLNPRAHLPIQYAAAAHAQLGRLEEARAAREEFMKLRPEFSIQSYMDRSRWTGAFKALATEGFRKAGFPEHPPLKLPDKPSIAVLPFANMSGDKEQEYFSDGITEDIITDLSKVSSLFVIARTSTQRYKGKTADVRQVSRDLGVRYVVEGSVRRSGETVRITAQLIDATTGSHLWAERYDRPLADVFAVQDEIARNVVSELRVTLTDDERDRTRRKYRPTPEVHDLYLRARATFLPPTPKKLAAARKLLEKALALDPEFADGYAILSIVYFLNYATTRGPAPRDDIETAVQLANRAIALDETLALGHGALAYARLYNGQFAEAHAAAVKAMELAPGHALMRGIYARVLAFSGEPEEAIRQAEIVIRADPYSIPHTYTLGVGYRTAGRISKAIDLFELRRQQIGRIDPNPELHLAAAYMAAGREDDARATVRGILKIAPHFNLAVARRGAPYERTQDLTQYLDAIRKAGMPE